MPNGVHVDPPTALEKRQTVNILVQCLQTFCSELDETFSNVKVQNIAALSLPEIPSLMKSKGDSQFFYVKERKNPEYLNGIL